MLIDFYKIYNNINKVRWHVPIRQPNYLTQDGPASGIRNNEHSIVMQNKINTAQREYFFSNRIVPHWNKLPKSVIEAKSVNSFKNKLDLHLFNSKTLFFNFFINCFNLQLSCQIRRFVCCSLLLLLLVFISNLPTGSQCFY